MPDYIGSRLASVCDEVSVALLCCLFEIRYSLNSLSFLTTDEVEKKEMEDKIDEQKMLIFFEAIFFKNVSSKIFRRRGRRRH